MHIFHTKQFLRFTFAWRPATACFFLRFVKYIESGGQKKKWIEKLKNTFDLVLALKTLLGHALNSNWKTYTLKNLSGKPRLREGGFFFAIRPCTRCTRVLWSTGRACVRSTDSPVSFRTAHTASCPPARSNDTTAVYIAYANNDVCV